MFKKIKDSKWLYVVLSILMSVILWGYVIREANPDQQKTIREIPVTFLGTDVLDTRHLIISEGANQTMNLDVRSKLDVLTKLDRNTVTLKVDVSKIAEAGEYRLIVTPGIPLNVQASSVTVESDLADLYVTFTVSKREVKEIPVKAELVGGVAKGYQLGDIAVTPANISISGQEELVNQVAYAKVILTQDNMDTTYVGDLPFVYIGTDGKELTDLNVVSDVETVHVTFPIVIVKDIPLTVAYLPGGGATAENAKHTFGPKALPEMSISVSGTEADLAGLKEIILGPIDLAQVVTTKDFPCPITLAPGLTNESGITEVTVSVSIQGLTTREFDVENIQPINVPEGYTAEAVTQSRTVMVRGPEAAVNALFKTQFRIVVDVSAGIPAAAVGRFDIPAKVYLDGSSDVGVVGTYNISVSLSK